MNKRTANLIILILGGVSMIGPFTTDMYLPAFSEIAQGLKATVPEVGYSLSSFFAGICIGQLVHGPLIDRFGRRTPLLIFFLAFIAMCMACSWAQSIEQLVVFRFFQAFAASCGMVVNRAVVRDLFPVNETANVFSKLILVMGVAPIIAPTVGGYVVAGWGWQAVFWTLAFIGSVILIAVFLFLPESKAEDKSVSLRLWPVIKSYGKAIRNPSFLPFATAGAMNTGGLFALITGASFVYMDLLGLSVKAFGWAFGFNAACYIVGSQVNRIFLRYKTSHQIALGTVSFQLGSVSILIVFVVMNWISVPIMITFFGLYTFCLGMISPNALALSLRPFSQNIGVASAAYGSLRMAAGAFTSALVSFFMKASALPVTLIMAAASLIGLFCLLYGARRSRQQDTSMALSSISNN